LYSQKTNKIKISLTKQMITKKRKKTWDDIWENYNGLNIFGRKLKKEEYKVLKNILNHIKLPKEAKIIELGCGSGSMLSFFRKLGYKNSIGVDIFESSLKLCKKLHNFQKGKDIFLMDASKINFQDESFDMVFSGGMIEHYKNPDNIVRNHCRISKSRVLIVQPNHQSLIGKLKRLKQKIGIASWEDEYLYKHEDYIKIFLKFGFELEDKGGINFNEIVWMLFQRK